MSINRELSACFERIASLLEVLDANGFKINANRKVARILKEFPDDLAQYKGDRKGLLAIDGIGAEAPIGYSSSSRAGRSVSSIGFPARYPRASQPCSTYPASDPRPSVASGRRSR